MSLQTLNQGMRQYKEEMGERKQKFKPKQTKQVLSDPDVKKHLEEIYRKEYIRHQVQDS